MEQWASKLRGLQKVASVPFKMQPLLRNILTLVVIIVFISQIDAITTLVGRYGKFRDVFSISPNNLFGSFFPPDTVFWISSVHLCRRILRSDYHSFFFSCRKIFPLLSMWCSVLALCEWKADSVRVNYWTDAKSFSLKRCLNWAQGLTDY